MKMLDDKQKIRLLDLLEETYHLIEENCDDFENSPVTWHNTKEGHDFWDLIISNLLLFSKQIRNTFDAKTDEKIRRLEIEVHREDCDDPELKYMIGMQSNIDTGKVSYYGNDGKCYPTIGEAIDSPFVDFDEMPTFSAICDVIKHIFYHSGKPISMQDLVDQVRQHFSQLTPGQIKGQILTMIPQTITWREDRKLELTNNEYYYIHQIGKKHEGPCWRQSHSDCGC